MTDDAVRRTLLLLVVRDNGPGVVRARLQALQDHAALAQGLPHAEGMLCLILNMDPPLNPRPGESRVEMIVRYEAPKTAEKG